MKGAAVASRLSLRAPGPGPEGGRPGAVAGRRDRRSVVSCIRHLRDPPGGDGLAAGRGAGRARCSPAR